MSESEFFRETFARGTRLRTPERRVEDYRRAFVLLCEEPFDDLDKTLARMLEVLAITLDVQRVSFWVFEEPQQYIRCEHLHRVEPGSSMGPTLLRRTDCPNYFNALCQQLVIAVDDATHDPRTRELRDNYLLPLGVRSVLDVPVRAFGRYLGVLCHESVGETRTWAKEDETFAAAVATQVALAFEREHARQAQQKLLERSLRDDESQLANRLQLEQALAAYLQNPSPHGALVVASAAKEERETLFRRFLVYSGLVVVFGPLLAWLVWRGTWYYFPLCLVVGYAFAWAAHFLVEKNRPATFEYPLWSFVSDYKMMWFMITGRMRREVERVMTIGR